MGLRDILERIGIQVADALHLEKQLTKAVVLHFANTAPPRPRPFSLAADYTSWQDWKEQNPDGLVLDNKTGHSRDYSRDPYAGYENAATLYFEVHNRDQRFHEKEPVVGLTVEGKAKVWPLSELAKVGNWPLQDSLGGTDLRIHYRAHDKSVTIVDAKGIQLPAIPAYWFAWIAFYPETQVFLFE